MVLGMTMGTLLDMGEEKVRENLARRRAQRQGLRLERSRSRDPRATDYGTYQLVDVRTNVIESYGLQSGYGLTLEEVEQQLDGGTPMRNGSYPRIDALQDLIKEWTAAGRDLNDEAVQAELLAALKDGLGEDGIAAVMVQLLTGHITELSEEGVRAGTHVKNADGTYTRIK